MIGVKLGLYFRQLDIKAYYWEEYTICEGTKYAVTTTLVIIDKLRTGEIKDKKAKNKDRFFIYATNFIEIKNRSLTDEVAYHLSEEYRLRWGIETGYRVKKDFKAKTGVLDYNARFFLMVLSVILYNQWVLLNVVFAKYDSFKKCFGKHIKTFSMRFALLLAIISTDESHSVP